jgi:L-2-hydroxyglutarate oxidase LhgO
MRQLPNHLSAGARHFTTASRSTYDYVVVGAGIVGTNIAAVLRERKPGARILLLDKERDAGLHASGRNSGVIHAGMYYTADSLKARLTRAGNVFMTRYCEERGLPIRKCGKLIVAKSEADLAGLDMLLARGKANGVPLEEVDGAHARRIEPLVKTHHRALWSPTTSSADPGRVLHSQLEDLTRAGVSIETGTRVADLQRVAGSGAGGVPHMRLTVQRTSSQRRGGSDGTASVIEAGHVINAAGLYADKLAHRLGFAQHLSLVPFIGLYMYSTLPVRTLVYPVPDLGKPFLGVHFTVTVDGSVKIGPTAIPALWREQYPDPGANWLSRFSLPEMADIAVTLGAMAAKHADFRRLAVAEARKYWRSHMIEGAAALVEGATEAAFGAYGRPGIRAQLVDRRTHTLEMDYVVRGDGISTHVLNAVSPAWTCSRPFAELVVQRILGEGVNACTQQP